jgi:hypothetical protein
MDTNAFNNNLLPTCPNLPNIQYYNKSAPVKNINSEQIFIENMATSCGKVVTNSQNNCLTPGNCDFYTESAFNGTLADNSTIATAVTENPTNAATQIQYMAVQLARARARNYDSNELNVSYSAISLKEIFKKFPNLKPFLIVIFFVSLYLLIYGFFSSFDVCINILSNIQNNVSISYWLGLLVGLLVPFIILTVSFNNVMCNKVVGEDKYDITNVPTTDKKINISATNKTLDISIITIFLVAIFAFTALLFILKKEQLGDKLYTALICSVFIIISILIYLFYAMTPYFVSANQKNILSKEESIKIFIDNLINESKITSNKDVDTKVNGLYIGIVIFIFILALIFFSFKTNSSLSNSLGNGFLGSFLNGFLGSAAILIIPILWVINYTIGMRYFYIYPILIIVMRFIRYIGMFCLYFMSNSDRYSDMKDNFSPELNEELDNIKDYSPSWSLLGIDILKTYMNMKGLSNEFSKKFVNNNNSQKNIAQDKYFSSLLFFRFLLKDNISENKSILIIPIIILILTGIIGSTILYGVFNVQDIKETPYKLETVTYSNDNQS